MGAFLLAGTSGSSIWVAADKGGAISQTKLTYIDREQTQPRPPDLTTPFTATFHVESDSVRPASHLTPPLTDRVGCDS